MSDNKRKSGESEQTRLVFEPANKLNAKEQYLAFKRQRASINSIEGKERVKKVMQTLHPQVREFFPRPGSGVLGAIGMTIERDGKLVNLNDPLQRPYQNPGYTWIYTDMAPMSCIADSIDSVNTVMGEITAWLDEHLEQSTLSKAAEDLLKANLMVKVTFELTFNEKAAMNYFIANPEELDVLETELNSVEENADHQSAGEL